ncbi:tRNA uridine-5-carboxymethylaminomethyl(34) synthesis GTPase MnmE [Thalassococcus sp. CAU 1522]|uniref:tRNA modification GTPase MnmE n=1 Tax=Thalassococcus arenae TaxID=2851652 RepID=A0ABS6N5W4_9RHOB|nr:tRNA uridine-5-carboxymethylaminomethyl(34) synthesis GTPase MnmE [Thalassococcus arenae]MBV2359411.1 tRNA uridine-5-carboxymethylaminomethyl(34) synthesis GTPase MnmE [Thalassococcus arenae]
MDTIFAQASAPGKAGVAVIRVSGPLAFQAVEHLAGDIPKPRYAALRKLKTPGGEVIDEALVLCFAENASFTGERVVEFQLHGSIAVVASVMGELTVLKGFRPAEPGEFTRRALENGRLDLAQVEALADLIDAETEAQREQAMRLFSGALGQAVAVWRDKLIHALSLLEATLDFADEEVPVDVTPDVLGLVTTVKEDVERELRGYSAAERIRSGFEVAIVGAPNVGKSTLLNRLAGRQAAIVSAVAGTTRDVIEVRMDIKGLAVTFLDTAGLRETDDEIEAIGVDLARRRAANADLRVFLVDDSVATGIVAQPDDIVVRSKIDLRGGEGISAVTGEGIDALLSRLHGILVRRSANAGLVTRERHRAAMIDGQQRLGNALALLARGPDVYDQVAEELRLAVRRLAHVMGKVDVEDILDSVFNRFCLGK